MNILEAIKTGKRFKRTSWYSWHTTKVKVLLSFEDVLSDDWEVEPDAPKYTPAECFLILSSPNHEFGYHTITDELRLSILYHLKSIQDSTLSSSKDKDEPKSITVGVEKY